MSRLGLTLVLLSSTACSVDSDDDCSAWLDACNECVVRCTPNWEVPTSECTPACATQEMPPCVADAGTCVFAE
jgi:hypothetical protein